MWLEQSGGCVHHPVPSYGSFINGNISNGIATITINNALKLCSNKPYNSNGANSVRQDRDPLPGSPCFHDPRCLCIVEPWQPIDSLPRIANFPLVVQGFAYPLSALCNWNRCVLPCSRCGCSSTIWLDGAERVLISRTSLSSWQLANIPTGVCVCVWKGGVSGHVCSLASDWQKTTFDFYIIVTSSLDSPFLGPSGLS